MRYRWGEFALDREARTLSRAGEPVRVQALVLDLLLFLLQQRGRVVADDVLRRTLWPDVRVTDASLRRLLKEARRALGDDGVRQEQIETLRGRGVRFTAEVTTDGWDTAFVGRGELLELCDQSLEAAAEGRGAVTLLHGPAGIGKTRALAELEARAAARDFAVLRGTGRAGAEADAFHLWLDAADELGVEAELRPPADAAARPVVDERRFGLFRDVARAITRAAAQRPLLLAFDDLQLADPDSLTLLRFVAPALRGARVWLVAALRSAPGAASDWPRDVAALATESSSQWLELRGLSAPELGAVVASQLRTEVSPESAALLATRTQGNPLLATELGRALFLAGHALRDAPPEELAASVSTELGALVARRCAALSDDTRRLLRTAAALGTEFDPQVVAESEGESPRATSRALDEARAAGLVDAGRGRLRRFAHPLIAEALYAELGADSLAAARQHLRIAEALERGGVTDPLLLARHFFAARAAAGAARALPWALAAGREARRRYAAADAFIWFARAAELAEHAGVPPLELGELLLEHSQVVLAVEGLPRSRIPTERAARIALDAGDTRLLGRAALQFAQRGFPLEAQAPTLRWLRAAREAPSGEPSLEARVTSRLAVELANAGPEREEVESLLRESESQARAFGDPLTLSRVLYDVNSATLSARDSRAWLARAEEVVRCARASGDLELELRAIVGRATAHLELGERGGLLAAVADARELSTNHPFPYSRAVTRGLETMLALLDGRHADARKSIEEYEGLARATESWGLLLLAGTQRLVMGVHESQTDSVLPLFELARARFPKVAAISASLALGYAVAGKLEAALGALATLTESLAQMPFDSLRLPALVMAAEVTFLTRAPIAAAALERELLPFAEVGAASYNAALYYGAVSQALGWLAAARGRSREAGERFQQALAMHTALASPPWCERSARAIREMASRRSARSR